MQSVALGVLSDLPKKLPPKDLLFVARTEYEARQPTSNRAMRMKRFPFPYLILFGLAGSLSVIAGPGIAYPDPPGGWTYVLDGSQAARGAAGAAFDALGGTWNYVNGSSEWDGSGVGPVIGTTNKPGGVSTFTEGDLTYPGTNVVFLRI